MEKRIYIIGAGEGISQGVAIKFGQLGFEVVLFSRTEARLMKLTQELSQQNISSKYYICDAGNTDNLRITLLKAIGERGAPTVLLYNAAALKMINILEETADSLTADFRLSVANVLTAVKTVKDSMKGNPDATILLTGGGFSKYPSADFGSLSIGKAGILNLGQSLFRALRPEGIHVGTVTVFGMVSPSDEKYSPARIADEFYKLYQQRETYEIAY